MARQLDDEKKANILSAARTTFGEHGFQKTTVKQIADQAGLAPGTLYTYFENKEELFSAVVEDIWVRFSTGMRNLNLDHSSFLGQLVDFVDFGFDLLEEIHPLLRGMFSEANRRAMLMERVDEICDFISEFFDGAYAGGIVFGPVKDPEIRRFNLGMMVSGILFRASLASPDQLSDELDAIKLGLLHGVRERLEIEVEPDRVT